VLPRSEPLVIENEGENMNGVFVGREHGRIVQAQILAALDALPTKTILPIDFRNARAVNFSFADEAIAKVVRRIVAGDLSGRYLLLINVSEGPREDIVAALKERECICVLETGQRTYEILGDVSPEMRETYEFSIQRERVTARDFIEHKDSRLSIAASSNRLSRMRDMGLLVSMESENVVSGGRQNIFVPVA